MPPKPRVTGGEVVVMASKLEVKSLLNVPNFFLQSMIIWRQVRKSPGVVGVSLRAQPLRGTFWTLSAWENQSALNDFSRSDPHARIVAGIRRVMKNSVFVFWSPDASELPIDWAEATRRVTEQERSTKD
ncbi:MULTISPECIES: DUF3291 domain-containing protein [unclassified Kitasatospora]|uniref:DUF3291 domain-containing protein n=1 Tax=unclassified Kitasatospora TaxID=2633591 RepID=UPI0032AEC957